METMTMRLFLLSVIQLSPDMSGGISCPRCLKGKVTINSPVVSQK